MALNQPENRYAWALEVKKPGGSLYLATRDLQDDAHVTDLGAPYRKSIISGNSPIVEELIDGFYGVHSPSNVTFTLDNSEFLGETAVTSIGSLELWLKGDSITGLAGGTIATWPDSSGNGHAATQASGTLRPTLQASVINGHNVARFDGTDDGMVTTAAINALPLSGFVVYSHRGGTADGFRRAVQSASLGNNYLIGPYQQAGDVSRYQVYNGSFLPDGPATTPDAFGIHSVVQTATVAEHWFNATSYGTNASTGVVGTIALGAGGVHAETLNGDIAEVIFYRKALTPIERQQVEGYLALKYGLSGPTVAPGLDPAHDWRGTPAVLRHYDLVTGDVTVELSGIIVDAQFPGVGKAVVTVGSHHEGLLDSLIPTQTLNPSVTAFANAVDVGAPTPVVFGSHVPVRPPYFASKETTTNPPGYDALVSVGTATLEAVLSDGDQFDPGLEDLSPFVAAPGSPSYLSGTQFTVTNTDDMATRYHASSDGGGMPLRFMASGTAAEFTYTHVVGHSAGTVAVADNVLTASWGTVQIGGDYLVIRDGYAATVLDSGTADLTAIRTYLLDPGGIIAISSRSTYGNPAVVADQIITDSVWGLSSIGAAQTVNAASLLTAAVAFSDAGLGDAIAGALAHDRQQRRARDALNEILMLRGARLGLTTDDPPEWTITVDTLPAPATLTFGTGPGTPNNIIRILAYGHEPLRQAVRNLILAYKPLGRARDSNRKFTPAEYARRATCAVSSRGQDRTITSPWIRDATIAARVVYYLATKLKWADRKLSILVGQEGRQVRVGQRIIIKIPHLGIDERWAVARTTRTLINTQLDLIGDNAETYTFDAGQVQDTGEPVDDEPERPQQAPSNLLRNPSFDGPLRKIAISAAPLVTALAPEEWDVQFDSPTQFIDSRREEESAAVAQHMESGHYWELELLQAPAGGFRNGISSTTPAPVMAGKTYVPSIRCDQAEGLRISVIWEDVNGSTVLDENVSIVHDAIDVNGEGWGRFYGRAVAPTLAVGARALYSLAQTGTYRLEAPMFHEAGPNAKPVPWKNEHTNPTWLRRTATATLTAGQANIDVTDLILPGEEVKGVLLRVTSTVSFQSGGASYSVGLPQTAGGVIQPGAWGDALTYTAVDAISSEEDWNQPSPLVYATGATVRISVDTGAFGGGTLLLTALYRRELPAGKA